MINRIRDIRKDKGLTLAEVAERCSPPTTAQTIGRLETGMRQLSLAWMNRIAAALQVDPQLLVRSEHGQAPTTVARLTETGAEALGQPREALLPTQLTGEEPLIAIVIETSTGEYRAGDQLWLRQIANDAGWGRLLNRDVLVPRPAGRFAFGRLVDRDGRRLAVLPPGIGQRQIVIENPAWLAVAAMLVRPL
ncbi:helix-turn-helix domain-containing protein [Novosphingobium piscinae]|uniref:Helix-turn-helix transcriptional regulator n=1 Tax=Novosphingobium piscinae TaxID=1507448 RepID=A0A7X1FX39_9SPHN|nr:helix-turn-helix transcriptional regulator [Novosphingobium piscinae]MBC2668613.1 helix-turn-helix transcriptional regulator [Novosphingobium piscinae]